MKISIIQPSRNNLKYLKWSYDSIRKNQGNHEVQICVADDASSDGTREWLMEQSVVDPNLNYILNNTGKRLGHTILYDRLISQVAKYDLCMIFHADMYLCPGALDAIEKHMFEYVDFNEPNQLDKPIPKPILKTITSLTRIEPPLHPDGQEKILANHGVEPEEFNEDNFLEWFFNTGFGVYVEEEKLMKNGISNGQRHTEGIFAPWAFWKDEFMEIGGHDPLYAPQSKEDSDIFNRFHLNGTKFIQTWEGFVYHMTCRGSRRNTFDGAPSITQNNPAWEKQNVRSSRNFIRKWGHFVRHDQFMKPIVPSKYDVGLIIKHCTDELLHHLEPWGSNVYVDMDDSSRSMYIDREQDTTSYDMSERVRSITDTPTNDILVEIDARMFRQDDYQNLTMLSDILTDSGEVGVMTLGTMQVSIRKLDTYERDLIVCTTNEEVTV